VKLSSSGKHTEALKTNKTKQQRLYHLHEHVAAAASKQQATPAAKRYVKINFRQLQNSSRSAKLSFL